MTTSSSDLYTCPTGVTAVLKCITAFNQAGSAGNWFLRLNGTTDAHVVMRLNVQAGSGVLVTEGFIVLAPGDVLKSTTSAGTFTVSISGAELDGVAP